MQPRVVAFMLAVLAVAVPTGAQSTYVGASIVGDFARFSKVEIDDNFARGPVPESSIDGEALGFNVRVGRELGERWGVELEFGRSGGIENRHRQFVVPVVTLPELPAIFPPIPNFEFAIESEQRHTTIAALLWLRQEIGDHIDLAYLGGVAFNRAEVEQQFRISDTRLVQWASIATPDYETITHGVGPAVGLEADIKVGEHAAITTGVRLHGANVSGRNGWLIRPLAGLRWRF